MRKYILNIINHEARNNDMTVTVETDNIYNFMVDKIFNKLDTKYKRIYCQQEHQIKNNEFEIMRLTRINGNMDYITLRTVRFMEVGA
jgi:hypothetical protein